MEPAENTDIAVQPNALASDPEMLGEFVVEAREHLSSIELRALAIEQDPGNKDAIHAIFRAFHTIKGLAGFLDLTAMQSVAHEVETVLDLARNGELHITAPVIDAILESKDLLSTWVAALDSAAPGAALPAGPSGTDLIERIHALIATPAAARDRVERDIEAVSTAGIEELARAVRDVAGTVTEPAPEPAPAPVAESVAPATAIETAAPAAPPEPGARRKDSAVVKVQTSKLDYLVDMVGEMVIAQSLIRHDPDLAAENKQRLARNLSQLARITDEVQRTAMSMRMVPVGQLFQKMSRLVRDLSQKTGKEVELALEGEDTELDRNIVEELSDPLMHMVRNALDHGIEPPEERVKAGKPESGRITSKAGHQSGHIVIDVVDNGKGLDRAKILDKAVERGLAAAGADLSDAEVFNFIFHPGFSTAAQVTDVSGRGVGMDVVRKHIQKLDRKS